MGYCHECGLVYQRYHIRPGLTFSLGLAGIPSTLRTVSPEKAGVIMLIGYGALQLIIRSAGSLFFYTILERYSLESLPPKPLSGSINT